MAADGRLATSIDPQVGRRLRMFALLTGQSLSDVLSEQLDRVLPSAADLASQLVAAPAHEAVAS